MKKFLMMGLVALFFTACGPSEKQIASEQSKKDSLKADSIAKIELVLKAKVDSLKKDSLKKDSITKTVKVVKKKK